MCSASCISSCPNVLSSLTLSIRTEQNKAEQNKAEQSRTKKNKEEQRRTEQRRAEKSRTKKNKEEQSRTEQRRAEQITAEQSRAAQRRTEWSGASHRRARELDHSKRTRPSPRSSPRTTDLRAHVHRPAPPRTHDMVLLLHDRDLGNPPRPLLHPHDRCRNRCSVWRYDDVCVCEERELFWQLSDLVCAGNLDYLCGVRFA